MRAQWYSDNSKQPELQKVKMSVVEKHIQHFNKLSGKEVRKDTLVEFYNDIPSIPQLQRIRKRVKKAIDQLKHDHHIAVIPKFKPVKVLIIGQPKHGTLSSTSSDTDHKDLLHGLQHIQNDKDFKGESLDGIGDTTYKVITDRILELIASGGLIWRKPWNEKVNGDADLAHNYVTKHIYKGGNYYLNYLRLGLRVKGKLVQYDSPSFFTFKQVTALGGKVIKDEKGWPVIYFKWLYKSIAKNKLVEKEEALEKGSMRLKKGYQKIPGLFYYNVFNFQQCEGLKISPKAAKKRSERDKIDSAEQIIERMPQRPPIKHGGDRAFYSISSDSIQVPYRTQFEGDQQFYSVNFHEMVHSTGHKSRIDRDLSGSFGSKPYAFEELIAELGASYLCGHSGILYFTMKNSAAYIADWSTKLKDEMSKDPKFFLRASSQAQKAADFILAEGDYEKLKKKKSKAVKNRPAAKRAEKDMPTADKTQRSEQKPAADLAGFTTADKVPVSQPREQLPGEIGAFLQKLQRYKLVIGVVGETHSSKSELGKQIADAFASVGDEVAWLDWEQGGLDSDDTVQSIHRNIKPENRKRIHVTGNLPKTIEAVKGLAKRFKVVALDSGTSLKMHTNAWMDELREQFPHVVWIILHQQNAKGMARGGPSAEFDLPVVIYTYRPDESDYERNYAYLFKSRGNKTGRYYNIAAKKIVSNPDSPGADSPMVDEKVTSKAPAKKEMIYI